jgi:hypothetical protein
MTNWMMLRQIGPHQPDIISEWFSWETIGEAQRYMTAALTARKNEA